MNLFYTLLTQPLANGLIIFYKIFFENMGLAIIAFSLFLKFILNPLTKPYMDSMKKMKDLAPELEKLKKRHSGDKIKWLKRKPICIKKEGSTPAQDVFPTFYR